LLGLDSPARQLNESVFTAQAEMPAHETKSVSPLRDDLEHILDATWERWFLQLRFLTGTRRRRRLGEVSDYASQKAALGEAISVKLKGARFVQHAQGGGVTWSRALCH
jgi:hypothetical protein